MQLRDAMRRQGHVETVRRSFDGRLMGQSGETPFVEVPDGPIDDETIDEMVAALPRRVRAPLRESVPDSPRAGCHLPRAARCPVDKVEYARLDVDGPPRPAARKVELRYLGDETIEAADFDRESLPPGSRVDGPASSASRSRRRSSARDRWRRSADREIVIEEGHRAERHARSATSTTTAFSARYRCDRFTATVLTNRFGYIVEHMCARRPTTAFSPILRDFYDFAATLTGLPSGLADPRDEQQHHPLHRDDGRLGANTIAEYGVERLEPGDVTAGNYLSAKT